MTDSAAQRASAPQAVAERAARIAAVAQLQAIVLRELDWDFPEINIPAGLPMNFEPQFEALIGTTPDAVVYKIATSIQARIPDGTEIFRLKSVHQLIFSVPEGQEFELEEHQAFASTSALFMAYPYIREVLQSTAAKAGMPMVLLAPLRMGPHLDQGSPKDREPAAAKD
jgi:preprotein translocase subunit SecB